MKNELEFDTAALDQALTLISTAATFDVSKPQYSMLRVRVDEVSGTVSFAVEDASMSSFASLSDVEFDLEPSVKHEFVLSLRLFANAVRVAPASSILLSIEKDRVKIKSGSFKVECAMVKDGEVKPAVNTWEGDKLFSDRYSEVKKWFSKVDWIVAKRTTSPAFTCAHLMNLGATLPARLVASNVTGLVEYIMPGVAFVPGAKEDIAIPSRLVAALDKFPIKPDDSILCSINKDNTRVCFSSAGYFVEGSLVESKFPTYSKILEVEEDSKLCTFDKDDLADILGRLNAVMTSEGAKYFRAKFEFDDGLVTVSSVTVGFPLVDATNYENENFEVTDKFSVKLDTILLEKGVRLADGDKVTLSVPLKMTKPVVVKVAGEYSDYSYALMQVS